MDARCYTEAFNLCDTVAAAQPDNFLALSYQGRISIKCGERVEKSIGSLDRAKDITPPPGAPFGTSTVWCTLGDLHAISHNDVTAHRCYATALMHNPNNAAAKAALARLDTESRTPSKER